MFIFFYIALSTGQVQVSSLYVVIFVNCSSRFCVKVKDVNIFRYQANYMYFSLLTTARKQVRLNTSKHKKYSNTQTRKKVKQVFTPLTSQDMKVSLTLPRNDCVAPSHPAGTCGPLWHTGRTETSATMSRYPPRDGELKRKWKRRRQQ